MSDATAPVAAPTDLWSEVVGQDDAVAQLRAAVRDPVHAYLLVGPPGSGRREATRAFAADLVTAGLPDAEVERGRRLAAVEAHPAVSFVEREGQFLRLEEIESMRRMAHRAPPEGDRQVFVVLDAHLMREAAGAMLKTFEEPPESTVFVLVSEELPPELATVASRCVRIELGPVPAAAVEDRLLQEGTPPERAAAAAAGAAGSMSRARLLARDEHLQARRDLWSGSPDRLDGTGAAVATVVDELVASIDEVVGPLRMVHDEELAELTARLEAYGRVTKGSLETITSRHKREQRRVRTDELLAGLAAVMDRYRRALDAGLPPEAYVRAAGAVQEVCDSLRFNPNERLALLGLFVGLPPLARRR